MDRLNKNGANRSAVEVQVDFPHLDSLALDLSLLIVQSLFKIFPL